MFVLIASSDINSFTNFVINNIFRKILILLHPENREPIQNNNIFHMENIKVMDFIFNEIDIISTHNILINNSDKLKLFASIRNSWPIFIIDEIFADEIFSLIILNQIPYSHYLSIQNWILCQFLPLQLSELLDAQLCKTYSIGSLSHSA